MKTVIQVIRQTSTMYEVHRVDETGRADGGSISSYELIGRLVLDAGLWFVEDVEWSHDGYKPRRRPRGYALQAGALHALTNKPERYAS